MAPTTPEEFFAGSERSLAVFRRVEELVNHAGLPYAVRTSKSQVAFRRRRGFAFLWIPGRYVRNPTAEVVLSIALDRQVPCERFKQVAHPAPSVWMHHVEIETLDDLDGEVEGWLHEAADHAG